MNFLGIPANKLFWIFAPKWLINLICYVLGIIGFFGILYMWRSGIIGAFSPAFSQLFGSVIDFFGCLGKAAWYGLTGICIGVNNCHVIL